MSKPRIPTGPDVARWYARQPTAREQQQRDLERQADALLRRAGRRRRKPPRKPTPTPIPERGWTDLRAGLRAMRSKLK